MDMKKWLNSMPNDVQCEEFFFLSKYRAHVQCIKEMMLKHVYDREKTCIDNKVFLLYEEYWCQDYTFLFDHT